MKKLRRFIYRILAAFDHVLSRVNPIIVLCYHSVASDSWLFSVSNEAMEQQFSYLISQGYQPLSLSQLSVFLKEGEALNGKFFAVTFDDGYENVLTALLLCQKYKIIPTVFALSDSEHVNRTVLATELPLLTTAQLKQLSQAGWEIGSHGMHHVVLSSLSLTELTEEVIGSKGVLEKALSVPVPYFAYPKGRYSKTVLDLVAQAGYTLGLSMDDAFITSATDRLRIPRIGVDASHTQQEFTTIFSPSVIAFRNFVKQSAFGTYF